MTTEEQEGVSADLLKAASTMPKNEVVETFNPLEKIPTLTVGQDFAVGMTIAGWVDETQTLASHKFKFSQKRNAEGVPTSLRHVLRIGSPTGEKLGIWSCGELKLAFEKLPAGTFIAITYKGKGENASGQEQHFFEFKRGASKLN